MPRNPPFIRIAGMTFLCCLCTPAPAWPCTIFVLTNAERTLFFNNEDWSNPVTRLWFVPPESGRLGCAFVGFDNGWTQGGFNTAGLAFDWVAGVQEEWTPDPDQKSVHGNPAQRMLETCASVDEAVLFFRTHREPSFSYARILVADRTGASAIIGAKNGQLYNDRSTESRGFGFGWRTLEERLAAPPEPTVANGVEILSACSQSGSYPTQYSNVFDLKTGAIHIFPRSEKGGNAQLDLAAELAKGGHYYDIPQIDEQLGQKPRALLSNMRERSLHSASLIAGTAGVVLAGALLASKRRRTALLQLVPSRQNKNNQALS